MRSVGRWITGGLTLLVSTLIATATLMASSLPVAALPTIDESSTLDDVDRVVADAALVSRSGPGWVQSSLGCADSLDGADLSAFFAERRGPLIGWDNPHVIELGPERWLWLAHDTYLDYPGSAITLHDVRGQIQNVAFIQVGRCFHVVHRGTPSERENFELGDARIAPGHFLWPLGSVVHEGQLKVFWGETATSKPLPPSGHGITRNALATWLATYDAETLERLSFEPAPNSGVEPQYGFAVASDDTHSYLFGNTNQLNFWGNGGYENGPHSATRMFLARVPLGQLEIPPEYWDGSGWSGDAAQAVPYSERFYSENTMQPRFVDGQWISVVNRDGFFGLDVFIETADNPWGPWIARDIVTHRPRTGSASKNTYQPIILPWSSADTGVTIGISENAMDWDDAVLDPTLYRPNFFSSRWPILPAVVPTVISSFSLGGSVGKVR